MPVGGTRPQDGAQAFNLVHIYDDTIVHSVVPLETTTTLEYIDPDEARRRLATAGVASRDSASHSAPGHSGGFTPRNSPPTAPISVLR